MKSVRIDWLGCDGHGLCAEVAPELVQLDDWGYPIVQPGALPRRLEGPAKAAARACPKLAFHLERR